LQRTVELRDARACHVADFDIRYDGRISGSVTTSDHRPAAGASVEVISAKRVNTRRLIESLRVVANDAGAFEITEVPPGDYFVGVDLVRRMDARLVFPTTFYPGTNNSALATVVRVEGGARHSLGPLVLPPAREAFTLTGTVTFEDGSPVAGAFVVLDDGDGMFFQVADGVTSDFDGTFSFLVHEGLSYTAHADYFDAKTPRAKRIRTTVGPFVATEKMPPLKVVLQRTQ
jgi:hypothetical protein